MIYRITTSLIILLFQSECLAQEAQKTADAAKYLAEPISAGDITQLLFGLITVIGAIFLAAVLMRKFGRLQLGNSSHLKIIGGISLGQREKAVLVQIGEKQLLLGVAPGQVKTLYELNEPLEQQVSNAVFSSKENSFAVRLSAAIKQRLAS